MINPTVIIHTENAEAARELVAMQHPDLEIFSCDTYEGLPPLIEATKAEVVYAMRFLNSPDYPRAALVESPSVKWVSVGGSGTDHLKSWDTSRVVVTNSAGVAADMMAQYALGAMLHFSLGFPAFRAAQNRHEWLSAEVEPIDGQTVLIIGLGNTGEAVAARCKSLGQKTIGVRARPKPTENVDEVYGIDALPYLWRRADFVVVCVPLLDSTKGLVNSNAFAQMKQNAVIVDVSRGGVIDEGSLIHALDEGRIRGAALDVFMTEPLPENHKLWSYENVIITPHCSSVYAGWDLKSVEMFSENLIRYRRGENLMRIVDPQRGY